VSHEPGAAPAGGPGGTVVRHSAQELRILGPDEKARKRERIVDVLWEIQQRHGWIDDEGVRRAGQECDLTPQEVDEVATFYNLLLRRPAGRTKIYVCDSISCDLCGADQLIAGLEKALGIKLGETTADREFTLLPIVCLGHCEKAPCLLAGEAVHGPLALDAGAVQGLIQRIRNERGTAPSGG
jgi:NADH-quinone oxidoreductase subunit E